MSILVDWQIEQRVKEMNMIDPFIPHQEKAFGVSHGLSSIGYDVRLGGLFMGLSDRNTRRVIDVQRQQTVDRLYRDVSNRVRSNAAGQRYFDIQPNERVLGVTMERFQMPRNTMFFVTSKSTLARLFTVNLAMTVAEPGWAGHLTLEIANFNINPVRLYVGMGVAQAIFMESDETPRVTYGQRNGKYQNQGVVPTLPIFSSDDDS